MKGKPKFDATAVSKMTEMYNAKKTVAAIAKDMKTSPATIRSYLEEEGVYKTRKRKKNANRQSTPKVTGDPREKLLADLKKAEAAVVRIKQELMKALKWYCRGNSSLLVGCPFFMRADVKYWKQIAAFAYSEYLVHGDGVVLIKEQSGPPFAA